MGLEGQGIGYNQQATGIGSISGSVKAEATQPQRTLGANQVAVITVVKSAAGTPGNAMFLVAIGNMIKYSVAQNTGNDREAFNEARGAYGKDFNLHKVDQHWQIDNGPNKGLIAIGNSVLPAESQRLDMEVQKDGKVKLVIMDYKKGKELKSTTVEASMIKSLDVGFDLNPENSDNAGKKLNPALTNYLFKFATSQGEFAPKK